MPLAHANIWTSARNIAATLELSASDRGLVVMPLFHIHGLIAGLSAPLSRGGSVYCTPGFNALKFFAEMDEARPTWYTAVPTMHQAVLTRAPRNKEIIARHPLRFVRSSSSSMPPTVIAELEEVFKCPVIEAYGMTEATHQMASNPLRAMRKPGSVGVAAGPEIAIMDEAGRLLGRGETGEVVIRGENVTSGYENNPKANEAAFTDGWFRTGDQGVIDADGYLTLTGRLKEIINRGGEKISPREIDEALMNHPAVLQAVAFAVPHPMLGEEVGAAVVLREGLSATEQELGAFLSERLAAFKTPRKILFLAEIPKGATGKLQRIGLAAEARVRVSSETSNRSGLTRSAVADRDGGSHSFGKASFAVDAPRPALCLIQRGNDYARTNKIDIHLLGAKPGLHLTERDKSDQVFVIVTAHGGNDVAGRN